ncbi:MAG: alanine racemase [Chloroflexi bacterium]|nr:alanine racemase [Chloroflexota bacterium]
MSLSITKPTLLLDEQKVRQNIRKMAVKAKNGGVAFRPHFKTHQSAEIGEWFRQEGVSAITVSSVDMAAYFAEAGWDDILIAFPVNLRQHQTINQLAHRLDLHLLVESVGTAVALSSAVDVPVNVWLKVDAGYGRTGISWQDEQMLLDVAATVAKAPNLTLTGILTHAGNTYAAKSVTEIEAVYAETVVRLNTARHCLQSEGHNIFVSVGDTPGCSVVESFGIVDEIRPGNFVFYDLMQRRLGVCLPEEIAVGVACPIVAKHEADQRIILYGGAVHLSKERLLINGEMIYGRIARLQENGWGQMLYGSKLTALSQEHGILKTNPATFGSLHVGDVVLVLPVHSCLTVDLYRGYFVFDGREIPKMRTN